LLPRALLQFEGRHLTTVAMVLELEHPCKLRCYSRYREWQFDKTTGG